MVLSAEWCSGWCKNRGKQRANTKASGEAAHATGGAVNESEHDNGSVHQQVADSRSHCLHALQRYNGGLQLTITTPKAPPAHMCTTRAWARP